MALVDDDVRQAEVRMLEQLAQTPRAKKAHYDVRRRRIVVQLSNGLELTFPPKLAEGLEHGSPADLARIEISPAGIGLHWPTLDADLFVPGLLSGVFGSPSWMAGQMGRIGGKARSSAKTAAARANGKLGGRPRKQA